MAHTKLAAVAILLALLQVSCAVARHGHGPGTCRSHRCQGRNGSPPVSAHTPAILTVNSFRRGGDGGGAGACDGRFHGDGELVAALSTGWLRASGRRRCNKMIRISARGRSVLAKVVDECDTARGCAHNVVDASRGVWRALGLDTKVGVVHVTWSDA